MKFGASGKKRGEIHPRAMNFCRMHGHMTHSVTGLTCEIALITQSIRDINENIRDVVQETFQMVKNTKLGSDKSYIVHVFQRGSTSKADFIRTLPPRFYSKEFFPLYKSHSQHQEGDAAAQEKNPDDRANILKGGLFKIGIPLALIFFISGFYFLNKFFHPSSKNVNPKSASVSDTPVNSSSNVSKPKTSEVSDVWRVAGFYKRGSSFTVTLIDGSGGVRVLMNPPNFKMTALGVEVELPEGGFATPWTVVASSKGGILQ